MVRIDYILSIDRATEFIEHIDEEEVWAMLGKAQLQQQLVKEAMQSFIKPMTPLSTSPSSRPPTRPAVNVELSEYC